MNSTAWDAMRYRIALVMLLLSLVVGALLNPTERDHESAIAEEVNMSFPFWGESAAGEVLSEYADYNNYVLYSTMSIGGETVSVGYLSRVSPQIDPLGVLIGVYEKERAYAR